MEIREWLIIIVFVAIVLILLDGFRRKWLERKYGLRVKLDKNNSNLGAAPAPDLERNGELPNGGARSKFRDGRYETDYEVEEGLSSAETQTYYEDEVGFEDNEEFSYDAEVERVEPSFGDSSIDEDYSESVVQTDENEIVAAEDMLDEAPEKVASFTKTDQAELAFEQQVKTEEPQAAAEEVIVINVMARADSIFSGKDLLPILMKHNMRLGDMSIFHRYADANGNGPVMFSMANMVKPGTFDISQMEEFTTPGISFFLQLPNVLDNMPCFEKMLDAANTVKSMLNGELKDENRSVITRQTIEHSRQRIRDFELKQMSKKK